MMRPAGLVALLAALSPAAPAAAGDRDLAAVHYDLLLAEYCGRLDAAVIAGYRAEVRAVVARDALDEAAQQAERSSASIAFESEWGNRGLGGSGPWCRSEGSESAARLAAHADG